MEFKTKRELKWYIQGLEDSKDNLIRDIDREIDRYKSAFNHMDFDDDGNVLDSSVQPTITNVQKGDNNGNKI